MSASTPIVYLRDVQKRPHILELVEQQRNRKRLFLVDGIYCRDAWLFHVRLPGKGVGCTVNKLEAIITGQPVVGSGIQVGLSVTFGIVFAVGVCGGTSAGHFNPSFTIAHCIYRGFSKLRALKYLVAQVLGGYIACMFVYYQYRFLIVKVEETLRASGTLDQTLFSSGGPAGMFAFYLPEGQSLAAAFLNEWISSVFVGLVYWASIDPSNSTVTPVVSPFVSALAYGIAIWGFGSAGAALNSARDVGSRLWVITVWGLAASGGRFAAISALTNIPAMLFAAMIYEMFLSDSGRIVTKDSLEQMRAMAHRLSESEGSIPYSGNNTPVEEVAKEMEIWGS